MGEESRRGLGPRSILSPGLLKQGTNETLQPSTRAPVAVTDGNVLEFLMPGSRAGANEEPQNATIHVK